MTRPKDHPSELPEGWQEHVLSLYREGASDVEIKAKICEWRGRFSNDLWDRWLAEEPEFSETIKVGKLLSNVWWEKQGRCNLQNREFSHALWYMNMRNRFGWSDKQEVSHSGKIEDSGIDKFAAILNDYKSSHREI